ncbi:DoxX family membrane protein [Nocardia sp. NPDC051833]|uniref:DoxX family membrane protein n=1 Tax=Nocardia sp. NPDC051833 TaxID=3155674 RepID=UPI0034289462
MPIKPVRRVARTLLAATFVAGGVNALLHPKPRAAAAAALADQSRGSLPDALAARIPDDPGRLVKVNAVTQIAGGVLLASGRAPRPAAMVLAATVIPGTVTEQDFWAEPDPDRRAAKRAGFLKDLGLLGGLLITASDTAGKPSLGWRARQALSSRESRVAAESAAIVGAAKVRGAHFAEVADARGTQLAEIARDRGPQLAEAARERGAQLAEVAKERGPELAEAARERSVQLAEVARERGPELAEAARERGVHLAEVARERGPELAETARERGAHLAEVAKERGPALAEVARARSAHLAEVARERGPVLAEAARERGAHLLDVAWARGAQAADLVREGAERFEEAARERRAAAR